MSNNVFKFLTLAALLVIFPAISYYYLTKGITYRKEIIKELTDKKKMEYTLLTSDSSNIVFKEKCTLVSLNENVASLKVIYPQFKEAKGFQLLSSNSDSIINTYLQKSNLDVVKSTHKKLNEDSFKKLKLSYPDSDFILLDSLGFVRRQYKANEKELARLAVHITTLAPYYDEKRQR